MTWFVWTVFVHKAESSVLGLTDFLFKAPSALPLPWQNIDPLVIGLPLSALTLTAVWYAERHLMKDEEAPSNGKQKAAE